MNYNNKRSGDEERVFSITMTEEELKLFSKYLEQKDYSRKDYEGLDEIGKLEMKKARSRLAKDAWSSRKRIHNHVNESVKNNIAFAEGNAVRKRLDIISDFAHSSEVSTSELDQALKKIDERKLRDLKEANSLGKSKLKKDLGKEIEFLKSKKKQELEKIRLDSNKRVAKIARKTRNKKIKNAVLIGSGIMSVAALGSVAYKKIKRNKDTQKE